jgi:hypothetical protein
MDAKSACDKLNGFNFQNRYLVGKSPSSAPWATPMADDSSSIIPPAGQDGEGNERSR